MTSRLDRLLLLLDTGSSSSVRNTAAKQLAQLAAKSVISDVAVQDDIKSTRHHVPLGDSSAWSELMAVVARVSLAHCTLTIPHADTRLLRFYLTCIQRVMKQDQPHQMHSHKYFLSCQYGSHKV
jgi:hypothetical protein